MDIIIYLILIMILIIIYYFINNCLDKEHFCYGNTYCGGDKDSRLCINQSCRICGLNAECKYDSDCGPNNCINGCCDGK